MNRRACGRGFTLIELLIVMAMITIMLVIAVPSFTSYISNYRVTGATNDFLQGVALTRNEAMRRGRRVVLMPNDATGAPSLTGSWVYGWSVCDQLNAALTGCATVTNVMFKHVALESSTVVLDPAGTAGQPFTDGSSRTYISFDGTGYPRTLPPSNGTLTGGIWINDTIGTGSTNRRTLCLAILGPPRIIKNVNSICQ